MLETKRLLLRTLEVSDAERVEELASDYEIAKTTLNIPHPYPKGSAVEFIQRVITKREEGLIVNFAIIHKEMNSLIGLIDLGISKEHNHAELGYWIGRQYWNQGYGTEAAERIIEYGFTAIKLNKIFARASAANPGSWRIMEKVGMSYEGTQKQHYYRFGNYIDIVRYGILKTDYFNSN